MPVIPFIPAISAGVGALSGHFGSEAAQRRSPEEEVALRGQQGAAGSLLGAGTGLLAEGRLPLQQATSYYGTLLRGNRGALAQATAAPAGQIRDLYAGAERGLERYGRIPTGAARAELARERAGKLAGLVSGVQPGAASALAGIGSDVTRTGLGAMGQAGSLYSGLLGQGFGNRVYGRAEGQELGVGLGGLIFDLLRGTGGGQRNPVPGVGRWSPGPF